MEFHKVVYGRADDAANGHAVFSGYFFQYVPEVIAYGTNTVKGIFLIIGIVCNEVAEKILERGTNDIP
jgi:hypothetical protein